MIKEKSILLRSLFKKLLIEPIHVVEQKVIDFYYDVSYSYYTQRLITNADTNRPVEVAIFIMIAENWNSFESVYRCMMKDKRINITVYVFPGHVFTDKPKRLNLKLYAEVLSFFSKRGINVVKTYDQENNTWISPKAVKADYVFYDEPYGIYPPKFSIMQMYKRARLCYIPYGYIITRSERMLQITMPLSSFRLIYAFFSSADYVADHIDNLYRISNCKYHHILRFGYPRFDITHEFSGEPYAGGSVKVLWIPRFTLKTENDGDPSSNTTFFEFRTEVIERASQHTDEYWIIRPHPRAFAQYLSRKLITRDELNHYISSLENNPRTELDKNKDYLAAFQRSDVMLADYSAIIVEYLAMGKSVIYCGNLEAVSEENIRECMYHASSWSEAISFLDNLKNGIDPLAEKRRALAAKLSSNGRSGELITEFLINDYTQKGIKS